MEWPLFIFQLCILIILYVVGLILKNFFPAYFSEKGKNIATKEDISEITKNVEEAKKVFTDKTEELKAQLLFQNQHNLSWKAAEREALIDYNKKVSAWLYFIIRFPLSDYNLENYKELKKQGIELDKRQYECDIAEAHVNLFDNTKELTEHILKINLAIIKLEGLLEQAMMKAYHLCVMYEINIVNKQQQEVIELHQKLLSDLHAIYGEFGENRTKQFEEAAEYHAKIGRNIREKLREINK
ncbi:MULTISPECIES: hypothetical protein [Niastella]|uniref:Uncharacterized protein n=1 Tax=Niastella soli TaxID=2821487 RepID=A0ABS3YZ55_9BACT|nr:hypothetical protein [Niastella soli]MBO9203207.1 hypothetical protein [Niastella soli]